jgi:hypothetical protein
MNPLEACPAARRRPCALALLPLALHAQPQAASAAPPPLPAPGRRHGSRLHVPWKASAEYRLPNGLQLAAGARAAPKPAADGGSLAVRVGSRRENYRRNGHGAACSST